MAIDKRSGFSTQKIRKIVKQLEERHIIWGYTFVTNVVKMNEQRFILWIKRTNEPLDKKIMDKKGSMSLEVLAHPLGLHIVSSYYVHGTYDWIIVFTAKDLKHARKFCNVLNTEFPGVILQYEIQQILNCVREQFIFNPNRKRLQELME